MTRNLKALGRALVAALALSAMVASGASAVPALFTADVHGGQAQIHGGQIGNHDKGLIVNSRNLCAAKSRANADLSGQNGRRYGPKPLVRALGCGKGKR